MPKPYTLWRDGFGAAALLLAVALPIAIVPLGFAAIRIVQNALASGVQVVHAESSTLRGLELGLLSKTFAVALLIGVLATMLAWPCAWLVRRLGPGAMPLLLIPSLLPSSLAYSGWGLVRAPGTAIGDWIERSAQAGWQELPLLVGRVLAVGGLALWAFPLALLVLAPAVRRIDASVLEMLDLDHVPWLAKRLTIWRLCIPSAITAAVLVSLVMLGSPVPLHLAQVDTYGTRVWLALDRMPESQQWLAWLSAWPLVLAAAAAGWLAGGIVADAETGVMPGAAVRERRRWFGSSVVAIGVVLLATVVPIVMFALSVRNSGTFSGFLRVNADAIGRSLAVATGVAALLALICALAWAAAASGATGLWLTRLVVRVLAVAGLSPGVLLGTWVAGAWPRVWPALTDSVGLVILAHAARFAFVAALVGLRLAVGEPRDRHDARRLDGGVGVVGWLRTMGRPLALPLVGVACISAVLSMGEIEASIMVAPPGFDTLARRLLDYLHFSRMEELSAAMTLLGCLGVVLGGLAALVVARGE